VLKVILQYRSVEILPLTPYKEVKQEMYFFLPLFLGHNAEIVAKYYLKFTKNRGKKKYISCFTSLYGVVNQQ
jgi:hypothetical protein